MASLKHSRQEHENVSSKVFVRGTKSGKVRKIVQEVYLREDIPCSSRLCRKCLEKMVPDSRGKIPAFILSEKPKGTKRYVGGHYIVPDTNAFLNGLDLFEQSAELTDVIILQTVLEELRNRSLPFYHRLLALTKNEDKRFYIFFNEFRRETYINREPSETINDRNDRAVRRATQWYRDHLRPTGKGHAAAAPDAIMITDDRDNLKKAKAEHISACSLSDYVSGLEDADRLLDMITTNQDHRTGKPSGERLFYPEYYSMSRMMTGVKAGNLHQGVFNVSPYNYLEGTVQVPTFDRALLVLGRSNSNRAIAGDVVVVELLPKSQWRSASTRIVEEETLNQDQNVVDEDAAGEAVVTDAEIKALQQEARRAQGSSGDEKVQPTARIIGIIKRNWRQYVGHVDAKSSAVRAGRQQQYVFVLPMDKQIPKIRVQTRQAERLSGQRILVSIDGWEVNSRYPVGHFVRSLGELEAKATETEALLLEYDVQYRPFPKNVLDCLPSEGHNWKVPADMADAQWHNRRDLRDVLICSIDPVGCQDIDDALHARRLANGNFEVGVHIADVSHFVKPGTAMDMEASVRGTTVYLVDKRIDMLPMILGTDLCSLKPHVERFAFSCIWEMKTDGTIVRADFTKSVIRSREAFTYEEAQLQIDDAARTDELTESMRILLALSKILKNNRMAAGALNLASAEVRVQMDSEASDPIDVKTKQLLDTNSLVEEFMLLANISVAGRIHKAFPQTALLRRHAAPPPTNFDALSDQLRAKRNMSLDVSSSKTLAASLDLCIDPNEPFFNTLVRILATRCMMSAEYFCSGNQPPTEFRHYGLASEIYTHFTSPIRRYADLQAHRQLAAAIGHSSTTADTTSKPRLEAACRNLNNRHRNAQKAGRASVAYYVGQALKGQIVDEDAFVMRVFENGFVVFVPRFGIEGLIRLSDMNVRTTDQIAGDNEVDHPDEKDNSLDQTTSNAKRNDSSDTKEPRKNQRLNPEYMESTNPTSSTSAVHSGQIAVFDAEQFRLTIDNPKVLESDTREANPNIGKMIIELFGKVRVRVSNILEEGTGKRKVKLELIR